MKITPKKNHLLGRVVDLTKSEGGLVLPNTSNKVTVFILIDAVGPDVIDYKPGEIVLALKFNWIHMRGGQEPRVIFEESEIIAALEAAQMDRFTVLGSEAA